MLSQSCIDFGIVVFNYCKAKWYGLMARKRGKTWIEKYKSRCSFIIHRVVLQKDRSTFGHLVTAAQMTTVMQMDMSLAFIL